MTVSRTGSKQAAGKRTSVLGWLYDQVAVLVDRVIGWDKLPTPLGLATLVGLRNNLRQYNLYDTSQYPVTELPRIPEPDPRYRTQRSEDGSYNNLENPREGMAGSRFGRNVPAERTFPEQQPDIMTPSPREISRALMTREKFIPAPGGNTLIACWLQFMIRDWFSHGRGDIKNGWKIELAPGDPWKTPPMLVPRTQPDPTRPPDSHSYPATYINHSSPWWDASQLYGNSLEEQKALRTNTNGKLKPPEEFSAEQDPGNTAGFWLGLALMYVLFIKEHNAICDRLADEYPDWSDEELFQRARLINCALIAKIHTVEWTPAVINHPTTVAALNANWYGLLGKGVKDVFGRVFDNEALSGIIGGEPDDFGVPYSLTEEFVAVYRMHELVPDDYSLRSVKDDTLLQEVTLRDLAHLNAADMLRKYDMGDLFYSFGTSNAGLVTLRNFPRFLQEYERPDGKLIDLASVDILRCRELGVPRYNEFRRLLNLKPAADFGSFDVDAKTAEQMRALYNGKIEDVDLIIGMLAEKRPKGFAFSDTAFRIFVLMASRRLNSDRFFTKDYTPEVYTQVGLDWVEDNNMSSVLLRHFPELRPAMEPVANAFGVWQRSGTA